MRYAWSKTKIQARLCPGCIEKHNSARRRLQVASTLSASATFSSSLVFLTELLQRREREGSGMHLKMWRQGSRALHLMYLLWFSMWNVLDTFGPSWLTGTCYHQGTRTSMQHDHLINLQLGLHEMASGMTQHKGATRLTSSAKEVLHRKSE